MKGYRLPKAEVVKAIEKKEPSHIPGWYDWIADETWELFGDRLSSLLENYQNDIILADYDMPEGFTEPAPGRDEWHIYYINEPGVFSGMRASDLRDSWEKMESTLNANFPDPSAPGRFETVKQLRTEYPDNYMVGHWWALFFERFIALQPEAEFLMDLYTDRAKIVRLGWKMCDFFCGIIDGFADAGMDGIFFSDDLGFSNQLIFSPQIFREVFKPWYKKIFERIHSHGMHVLMHSCGYLWEIIPDLIDIGLDVHHFQPSVMDIHKYVREYGKDLTFFGGIDIQEFMIDNDPAGIRSGVQEIFETLDHDGGGYMAGPSNTLMSDTPFENIVAMYEAMNEFAPRR
ncbi:MAG: hypothetical protein K9L68_06115 [Spirochaetales bacterium]|nr:hypothetical protein [Spirochaetales bacterium]MCF7938157.1 hypothetical protein [Spirochaetales bacterium]